SVLTLHLAIAGIQFIVTNPTAICGNTTTDLTSSSITAGSDAGLSFSYWKDAAATIPLTNPNAVIAGGTYYIKAINSAGCSEIRPVIVTINIAPTAVISGGSSICAGASSTLIVTLTGKAPFQISYTDGTNSYSVPNINSTSYQLNVTPSVSTTYTITNVSDAICSNPAVTSTATVTVIPAIAPVRYPTITVNANTATQLNARNLGTNYTYQWTPTAGLNSNNIINPVFSYDKPTEYKIIITTDKGCTVTDTLLVKINPIDVPATLEDIITPKAWTPNGDGQNDLLRPKLINIRELKYFRIYNRWGELVYETNTEGQGWNGIYKGKPQVMDTYTWIAEGTGISGAIIKRTGNSVLLR
ncbi:MAG: gliding motility-associated C-terminal domain-containing protein, partial [Bacteroidetes bacterium]|nr:gliding motility-associated C-terminal domain-containing protein [Bacteroidota bacterium]